MKIIKIGGTALSDINDINRFIDGIGSSETPTIYVISAFSMLSSELKYYAKNVQNNADLINPISRFTELYSLLNTKQCKIFTQFLENVSININRLVLGTRKTGEIPKIIIDEIMSYGELLSSYFIYCLFSSYEIECQFVDARELIITDDNYGNATPNLELSVKNIIDTIDRNKTVITQGFIGSDINGRTTTMGFESSNLSATIFAKAVNAIAIEIIMKVKQIYTFDPTIYSSSLPVLSIPYVSAKLLATNNFKLIFSGMIDIASENNIVIIYRGLDQNYSTIISNVSVFELPVILECNNKILITPISKEMTYTILGELLENLNSFNYNNENFTLEIDVENLHIEDIQTKVISLF